MRKKFFLDVLLNIVASGIPIFALQFVILPTVASRTDAASYGQLLTIVALMTLTAATLGNILNNSRLISSKKYEELDIKGDFSILLVIFLVINIIMMSFGLWYYESLSNLKILMLIMFSSVFLLLKEYGKVDFRIKLNFKSILIESVVLVTGFVIGLILFLVYGYWQLIYFFGFGASFIFIYYKTNIFKEPFRKTEHFKITTSQTMYLLFSGLLTGFGTYLDRLLLYPLLGGTAVSVYFTATILGKTISLVIQPVAGVLLSYLARLKKIDNKKLYILLLTSLVGGGVGYILVILISRPILTLIYPQYVNEAMSYIYVTTLTIIITIIMNLLNPIILKFCDLKWQVLINTVYIAVFILLSVLLTKLYGLMGFSIGVLFASILKLIMMVIIYYLLNTNEKTFKFRKGNL